MASRVHQSNRHLAGKKRAKQIASRSSRTVLNIERNDIIKKQQAYSIIINQEKEDLRKAIDALKLLK